MERSAVPVRIVPAGYRVPAGCAECGGVTRTASRRLGASRVEVVKICLTGGHVEEMVLVMERNSDDPGTLGG